ncbi:hypothetical protein [Kocuria sabuli]|uniref:hypothetical protein n=1 Tax=Kocuria sabuli TaxID=3071448 RepID=UPI0034D62EDD
MLDQNTDSAFVCAKCGDEQSTHEARGLCRPCYQRAHREGTLDEHERMRPRLVYLSEARDEVEYLRPRVEILPETGCWRWLGGTAKDGYPKATISGRTIAVHRWALETIGGHHIPEDWHVDHQGCPTVLCVNPSHLQAVSPEEHRRLTADRARALKEAGPDYEWTPPTRVRNLLELAATIRLDDGRVAPPGAGIIWP